MPPADAELKLAFGSAVARPSGSTAFALLFSSCEDESLQDRTLTRTG
jgi:hypothetical protein